MPTGGLPARARSGRTAEYLASRLRGVHCCTLVDNGPPRAQVHDRFTLLTPTVGEALVWCRGERHLLTPGSVLMLEPGDVHRDLMKNAYGAVTVMVSAEQLASHTAPPDQARLSSVVARSARLASDVLELVEAVRSGRELTAQRDLGDRLFAALAPFWARQPPRAEPPLVSRVRRALLEAPSKALSLEDLATRLRCAPSYLCRVFSEQVGVGPHAYQLQLRLLAAARLLVRGETVEKAAWANGFSNASHLRRHFMRRFAIAPGRYQRELAPRGPDERRQQATRTSDERAVLPADCIELRARSQGRRSTGGHATEV